MWISTVAVLKYVDALEIGILGKDFNVRGINNGIALCKLCHTSFDSLVPDFVVLPLNLDYFLDFEKVNFDERLETLRDTKGSELSLRDVPHREGCFFNLALNPATPVELKKKLEMKKSSDGSGLPYQIYVRRDFLGRGWKPGPLGPPRIWHGNPQAMILHAARILGSCYPRGWLPGNYWSTLGDLMAAYSKEPWDEEDVTLGEVGVVVVTSNSTSDSVEDVPAPAGAPGGPRQRKTPNRKGNQGRGRGKSGKTAPPTGNAQKFSRRRRRQTAPQQKQSAPPHAAEDTNADSAYGTLSAKSSTSWLQKMNKPEEEGGEPAFLWGPGRTSNDAIFLSTGIRYYRVII
ncbi:hypothetical protein TWF281_010560 [Arthrobotrys megalospora]